ncbi:MAG: PqqD family protein [Prevotella sp.]|nr:PqqD family protein [Prevotella sp.]
MKVKNGFKLRSVCGEYIIVAEGVENIDFSRVISLNDSAAYLWKNIQDKEFNADDLAELILEEYEIDKETATKDSENLINQWKDAGIIE